MMKKMKLADVPFGENFEIWGHAYTVLDGDDKGVFVLEAETVCEMPFREDEVDYKVSPNDFRDSSVRAYLEGRYIERLVSAGAKLDEDILPMELDLKCTLGQHEYGTARVYAGLLTLEQYGKYYDIIPKIDTPYWLATPWKTPSRSPYAHHTYYVWDVNSIGNYNHWNYSSTYGVRPALTLSPSLLVSVECDEEEEVERKMRIERKRYVVMRNNRTEIWCGLAKNFSFRPISEIKDVSVKTYRSEAQAKSGCSSWDRDFEVVPVIEMIATEEALKDEGE